MEKVKVTKEVAEAIDFLKADDWSFASVMSVLTSGGFCRVDEAVVLNTIAIETVAQVYLNGYEIEKTPEQELASWYLALNQTWGYHLDGEVEARIAVETIDKTLNLLGIRVEGVNA